MARTGTRTAALLLLLMVALSASEVVRLSCDVMAIPGGLFQYRLSPEPRPDCQEQGWEDHNKLTLTRGCDLDPDLVHSLTNQTLVLKKCLNYTQFTAQCPGFVVANCSFDCSSVPSVSDVVNPPNNICFGERCFEMTGFVLICVPVLVSVSGACAGLWCFYKYKKRQGQRDLEHKAGELEQSHKDSVRLEELRPLRDSKTDSNVDSDPDSTPLSAVHVQ